MTGESQKESNDVTFADESNYFDIAFPFPITKSNGSALDTNRNERKPTCDTSSNSEMRVVVNTCFLLSTAHSPCMCKDASARALLHARHVHAN